MYHHRKPAESHTGAPWTDAGWSSDLSVGWGPMVMNVFAHVYWPQPILQSLAAQINYPQSSAIFLSSMFGGRKKKAKNRETEWVPTCFVVQRKLLGFIGRRGVFDLVFSSVEMLTHSSCSVQALDNAGLINLYSTVVSLLCYLEWDAFSLCNSICILDMSMVKNAPIVLSS